MPTQAEAFGQPPISWEEKELARKVKRVSQRGVLPFDLVNRLLRDNSVTNAKISDLEAGKITAGIITVAVDVGASSVKIDGANKRIVINDGDNDIILIGYQSGGF